MDRSPKHIWGEFSAFDTSTIKRETEYIVRRALDAEGRVVTIGPLLLFSTETGTAWILDPSDGCGHCLCCGGVRTELTIVDRGDQVAIEWTGSYQIDGDTFTFVDLHGRVLAALACPTGAIQAAARRCRPSPGDAADGGSRC